MHLYKILQKGDHVAISKGRIVITPRSGNQVAADEWLQRNFDSFLLEILNSIGGTAYRYISYTTGSYTRHKSGGVTMQMVDVKTGEQYYLIFNAEVRRVRNTASGKKGAILPNGRFTPPKQGKFLVFWKRTELPLPRRLSAFHDSISKLESIIFTGKVKDGNMLDKNELMPLEISHEQLLNATGLMTQLADNIPTVNRQYADKWLTRCADKRMTETQIWQGL